MMGPRFGGLLHDIFDAKHLADDFSLYLYRPSASDDSMAPEGCDSFYVLCPGAQSRCRHRLGQGRRTLPPQDRGSSRSHMLPGLKDHVVTSKLITPVDFRDRLLSLKGAAFGIEPVITQLAWFRPHNISEEVENLFIVGAGTHPGAGLPGVVSSAKILDKVVPHASAVN
jgi:phytoene desaturase